MKQKKQTQSQISNMPIFRKSRKIEKGKSVSGITLVNFSWMELAEGKALNNAKAQRQAGEKKKS